MKIRIKFAVVLSFALAAIGVWIAPRALMQTQTQTAGQKFKNIKVLNDMPADQLGKVMNIYSASLGVNCDFCHVGEEFDKDGKREKETARQMIKMTLDINKANFNGRTEVTCNTCHNGHEHPQGSPNLMPSAEVERPKQPEKKPLPDDIVAKYIAAVGGAEKLSAVKSRTITATRIEADGKTSEPEIINFKDGKYSDKVTYGQRWITDLWDGTAAVKFGRFQTFDTQPDEREQVRREADLFLPTNLKSVYPKLEFRFLDRLDGRNVYILQGTTASNLRERLVFDADTGLLVRRSASTPTMFGSFVYQVDYADYKDFDGIKIPTTIKYSMPNISWTKKITAVKSNSAIDDSVFKATPPEPRPTPAS